MEKIPSKWRTKIEVFIKKGPKLLVGERKSPYSNRNILVPVSGGVDENETLEDACKKESLEELGISINNIRLITKEPFLIDWHHPDNGFLRKQPGVKKRLHKYRGVKIYFLIADFKCYNDTQFNIEGDGMKIIEINKEMLKTEFLEESKKFFPEYMKLKAKLVDLI